MQPHRGWIITSSTWICLRKRWLDWERDKSWSRSFKRKLSARKKRKRQGIDHQHVEYYVGALQKMNKAKRLEGEPVMSAPPFFQSAGREDLQFWGEDDGRIMDLLLLYGKAYWNRSRSSGRKRWAIWKIGWVGAGRGKKTKSKARSNSMERNSFQTVASKQRSKQERRWMRKEAKDSQCAGKRGGDRATSNA